MNQKPSFLLRRVTLSCLVAAALAMPAQADVNTDLNKFFNKLGFEGNATRAAVWQGQAAGYATGGNLFLRNQVNNLQIASFTPPRITAGCGGIDAYLGSFSFVNSEQIERFIKQLMGNAVGYFFDLALQTAVPGMKQVDPQMLNISTFYPSLSDYIAYDILLQYLNELLSQARVQAGSKNFPEEQMKMLRENFSEASRQLEGLQAQVDVKANTLMELEQRMGYLRQQVSTHLMSRYEQNMRYTSVSSAQLTTGGN